MQMHNRLGSWVTLPCVTSQIFNLECYTLDHHRIAYFIAFWQILENPKQPKDPRRELGIFPVFIFDFYQIMKRGFLVLIIFLSEKYFILKYMRGENMTSPK